MSKHTDGPWTFDGDHYVIEGEDGTICELWPTDKDANGRLIAAAPDLLAALKMFVECDAFIPRITAVRRRDKDEEDVDTSRREMVWKMAEDAIAKAEGRK